MSGERGRPRDEGVNAALERALDRLAVEGGLIGVTVNRLTAAARTTKPTFYRRCENLGRFLIEVATRRLASDEPVDTGGLRSNLVEVQRSQVTVQGQPFVREGLPVVLAATRQSEVNATAFVQRFLQPRREVIVAVLDRAAERGRLRRSRTWIGGSICSAGLSSGACCSRKPGRSMKSCCKSP